MDYSSKYLIILALSFIFCCDLINEQEKINHPFELKISNHEYPLNFTLDSPWEERGLGYINVIKTDTLWHLWYESLGNKSPSFGKIDYNSYFSYAYSLDGVDWIKPKLGLVAYDRNSEHNIVISNNGIPNKGIHGMTVFLDPNSKEDEGPFKMVYARWIDSLNSNWIYGMTSKDGLMWENERIIKRHYSDTQTVAYFINGWYKLYYRYWNGPRHGQGYRQIGFSEARTFNESLGEENRKINFSNMDVSEKHLYNNATRVIKDQYELMFPSIFEPSIDKMQLKVAYRTLDDQKKEAFTFYEFDQELFKGLPNFRGLYITPQAIKISENNYLIYYSYKEEGHWSWQYDSINYRGKIGRFQLSILPK